MVDPRLFLSLIANVISSVGVIFINKRLVFQAAGYHFGTTLTIIHFICTFIGCLIFAKLHYFELKKLNIRNVLSICCAFCGYVVFNNLSLLTNSVSIYQISKILCTPLIVLIELVMYGKRESRAVLLALVPVCLGIIVTFYADADVNWTGTFWASLAVIANSFYTIWGKTKQQELGVTALQILTYQAPVSAAMLVFTLPVMDNVKELVTYHYTGFSYGVILLSCIFAFGVNFSFFLFVGQTSPLTMNAVGYLKTVLVFVGGFIFFDTQPTFQNVLGISTTLVGLAMYTRAKLAPVAPRSSA
eukprot:GILI01021505.1.p1 GENE.GILI01021505.1~~GILI01021505.1.p1  ORF type:complete len:301 (-),score=34.45 GILI01021505.1:101-1003(-)